MLKRKLYDKLKKWKDESKGTTALLIDGARRVGKSYLCEYFAQQEYKSYILIDFGNTSKEIEDLFENESTDLSVFFLKLSAYYTTQLHERNSLIILDEVQQFPRARQLIKYLVKDGRFDYIETGSLLSLKRNVKDIILPSEEKHIQLLPLDFEEFLWAKGDTTTFPLLNKCFNELTPLGQALHRKILNEFRQYVLVGGMPQVVLKYIETMDFSEVDDIKRNILTLYRNDISKFANSHASKVLSIFDEIPSQLTKMEKKYKLASLGKNARYRDYEDAFMWLDDAMIASTCFNCTDPNNGLAMSSENSTRKCYMADTGLLVTHSFMDNEYSDNELYKGILFDKLFINEGMLMENVVAQTLRSKGHKLYFYSRTDKENRDNHLEIDFVITRNRKICPVEVKSSCYRKHSSLEKFRKKFSSRIGESYILYQKDLAVKNGVIHLPIYMAIFL